MTTEPTPETAYVEVLARLLCTADVHVHGADHPTWQQLVDEPGRRIRDDYRKAAQWLAPRLTVTAPAAVPVVPPADPAELRDRIAEAIIKSDGVPSQAFVAKLHWTVALREADAVLAVLPATDRATVYAELIAKAEEWDGHITVQELRRLAAEERQDVSPAYARLQAAAHEANEAAHLHAMRGMRAVYQLCRQYGFGDTPIPAAEVLAALGLDENANPIEAAATAKEAQS
jgi:hypothetical protein